MERKYLQIIENFISVSLVGSDGEIIVDLLDDMESNVKHDCICTVCGKRLTVKQFKNGELIRTKDDIPANYYKHRKCG